jgi:hypothetical protein
MYPGPNASVRTSVSPIVERLNALQDRANAPMFCADCGGTFFYKVSAEQYSSAGYGSAAFRSLSTVTETVYICLCGAVVDSKETPGKNQADRHSLFVQILKDSIAHQKGNNPQVVAAKCASLSEVDELKERVKWLEEAFDVVMQAANENNNEETGLELETSSQLSSHNTLDGLDNHDYIIPSTSTSGSSPLGSVRGDSIEIEQISKPAKAGRPGAKKNGSK